MSPDARIGFDEENVRGWFYSYRQSIPGLGVLPGDGVCAPLSRGRRRCEPVGFLWDTLGGYFLVRYLIRDVNDIRRVAKAFVVIAVIIAPLHVIRATPLDERLRASDGRTGGARHSRRARPLLRSLRSGDYRQHVWWNSGAALHLALDYVESEVRRRPRLDLVCDYHHNRIFKHRNRRCRDGNRDSLPLATSQARSLDALGVGCRDTGAGDGDEGSCMVRFGSR